MTDLLGEHPRDEVAFGVTDLRLKSASSQRIGKLARGHWRILPRLHEGRDMTLDEDRSHVRSGRHGDTPQYRHRLNPTDEIIQ
ncbi:MAG: hypothetical protein M1415_00735 [Firmicutes bacterium]|nr:hypothetical protein [Bacillota bacterium]MCL5066609.1 hypothetical protein [Bacillota bacterium]